MSEQTSRLAIIIDSTGAEKNAENLTTALSGLTEWGMKAAASARKVTKATEDEKYAMSRLRAAIDPVGAAINTVGRRFTELKKYFDKGFIDKEEFEFLSRKLNETTEELSGVALAQREAEKAGKLAAAQQEAQAQAFQRMLDKIDPLTAALRNLDQQQADLNAALSAGKINTSQFDTYSKKLQETRREVTGEAQAEREAAKAHDEQRVALQRLVAQLDPVGEGFRRLAEQQKQLDSAKSSGLLSPESYTKLSGTLGEMRTELEKTQAQLGKTGMSAKQTAFAMRMIPAQMTDIVVGLSTGQSPFMVLMQQGGQLKDMFGGIGPAIKGVGSYVMGLINPFTLAAAAVGVLGVAYYKGAQEQDAFNKSLILTGNQVGRTSGQLADIATRAGVAANSTTGKAALTLNLLVESGKVAGDSLERVTTAVVKTSEATGITTDKLVDDFNKIAADPVAAITKLNDQYHFLTLATYNQIKALQDEGNQQEAARVASEAYSSSMIQRSNQIKENLGYLETAWNSLAKAAGWAWDAMLDVGRDASVEQKIQDASSELERAQKSLADLERGQAANAGPYGAWKSDDLDRQRKAVTLLKQRLSTLQSEKTAQDVINNIFDGYNQRQQKSIEAQKVVNSLTEQTLSNEQKRKKEQDKLTKAIKDGAVISKEEEARLRKNINDRYKDPKTPKTPKGKAYREDAATRLLEQLNKQYITLTSQFDTTEKIGSAQQALIKWEQQLSDIKSKKTLTADQKSLLANQEAITAQLQKNAAIEREIALRKDADKLTAYKNTLSSGLQNDATGLQNSLNNNTVLSQEQKRQQELTKIVSEYQKKQVELTNQRTTGQISQNLYDQETAALQQALNQRLAMQQSYYTQLDQLNGNWQLGVQNGLQSYLNSVPTLYESVTTAATSILSSTETAISSNLSAMVHGTESLSDGFKNMAAGMGEAVIDALMKMAAQWLVYQAVQLLVGKTAAAGASASMIGQATAMSQIAAINAYASAAAIPITGWAIAPAAMASAEAATTPLIAAVAAASSAMTAGAGFANGGYTGPGGKYQPAGIVHKGEYVFDQAATNRIGVSNLEALRNGGSLDATLGKPGFGTGAQNVNNNSNAMTLNAPINQNFNIQQGVTPDQMNMALAETQKKAVADSMKQTAMQISKGTGDVGRAMRGTYSGRRTS
ncbi:phage tail tape measure protein [Salmonella enterica subsp. enterica serovar Miami]|nr:phage tail tape measure protein [Salmonella enterica]EDQ6992183.1 phage tail tape measure protein [Salmonella enterica subsp. enterica serovar Saintpaul]EDV2389605.1 phage tail tape measure protein [Salmonella enterica subsp. enterica serovar Miami]EAZ3495733.1 phage tail tape measure protein [Salmonella enterica]EBI8329363.1 phage tail tape measure protein [Salmonella enterica]